MDPCKYCGDHYCCRAMCKSKKDYLDFMEGYTNKYKVKKQRKKVITINKNGIWREEYV